MSFLKNKIGAIYVNLVKSELLFRVGISPTPNPYWFKYLACLVLQIAF